MTRPGPVEAVPTAQGSLVRVPADIGVVAGGFDKLADRLAGTLRIMREIAKIAGEKG